MKNVYIPRKRAALTIRCPRKPIWNSLACAATVDEIWLATYSAVISCRVAYKRQGKTEQQNHCNSSALEERLPR